jgi:uncharacterized membrane protein
MEGWKMKAKVFVVAQQITKIIIIFTKYNPENYFVALIFYFLDFTCFCLLRLLQVKHVFGDDCHAVWRAKIEEL